MDLEFTKREDTKYDRPNAGQEALKGQLAYHRIRSGVARFLTLTFSKTRTFCKPLWFSREVYRGIYFRKQ